MQPKRKTWETREYQPNKDIQNSFRGTYVAKCSPKTGGICSMYAFNGHHGGADGKVPTGGHLQQLKRSPMSKHWTTATSQSWQDFLRGKVTEKSLLISQSRPLRAKKKFVAELYPTNVPLFASVGRNDFIKIYKSVALLLPNILPRLGHQRSHKKKKKKKKKSGILEDKSQLHDNP